MEAFLLINITLKMAKLGFGDLFELYSGNYIFLYKLATLITAICRGVMIQVGVKVASRVPWHLFPDLLPRQSGYSARIL